MKRFALIGASGYIAPRHMAAIKETGNTLVAAMDPNDSVGILDSYFPDANFFTNFEKFSFFVNREVNSDRALDYVSIASPNHLHESHIGFALRNGADAICEKPLVLNPCMIDALSLEENRSGRKVHTILQLRLHPAIIALREQVRSARQDTKADVDLTYITSRGAWYHESWKGEDNKAGGIATNIGVHFFDMLGFVYGKLQSSFIHLRSRDKAGGYLEFEKARVRWFLSLDINDVPEAERMIGKRTFRALEANGVSIEFSDGFTDLHTKSYQEIISGRGFGLEENRQAIEAVFGIQHSGISPGRGEIHPMVLKAQNV